MDDSRGVGSLKGSNDTVGSGGGRARPAAAANGKQHTSPPSSPRRRGHTPNAHSLAPPSAGKLNDSARSTRAAVTAAAGASDGAAATATTTAVAPPSLFTHCDELCEEFIALCVRELKGRDADLLSVFCGKRATRDNGDNNGKRDDDGGGGGGTGGGGGARRASALRRVTSNAGDAEETSDGGVGGGKGALRMSGARRRLLSEVCTASPLRAPAEASALDIAAILRHQLQRGGGSGSGGGNGMGGCRRALEIALAAAVAAATAAAAIYGFACFVHLLTFTHMSEPLVPFALFSPLIGALGGERSEHFANLRNTLKHLPERNLKCLQMLMSVLAERVHRDDVEKNVKKDIASALASVFAPLVARAERPSLEQVLADTPVLVRIVTLFALYYDRCFQGKTEILGDDWLRAQAEQYKLMRQSASAAYKKSRRALRQSMHLSEVEVSRMMQSKAEDLMNGKADNDDISNFAAHAKKHVDKKRDKKAQLLSSSKNSVGKVSSSSDARKGSGDERRREKDEKKEKEKKEKKEKKERKEKKDSSRDRAVDKSGRLLSPSKHSAPSALDSPKSAAATTSDSPRATKTSAEQRRAEGKDLLRSASARARNVAAANGSESASSPRDAQIGRNKSVPTDVRERRREPKSPKSSSNKALSVRSDSAGSGVPIVASRRVHKHRSSSATSSRASASASARSPSSSSDNESRSSRARKGGALKNAMSPSSSSASSSSSTTTSRIASSSSSSSSRGASSSSSSSSTLTSLSTSSLSSLSSDDSADAGRGGSGKSKTDSRVRSPKHASDKAAKKRDKRNGERRVGKLPSKRDDENGGGGGGGARKRDRHHASKHHRQSHRSRAMDRRLYIAVASYNKGNEPGKLRLREGDVVELIGEASGDIVRGRMNGIVGMFPMHVVRAVEIEDDDDVDDDDEGNNAFDDAAERAARTDTRSGDGKHGDTIASRSKKTHSSSSSPPTTRSHSGGDKRGHGHSHDNNSGGGSGGGGGNETTTRAKPQRKISATALRARSATQPTLIAVCKYDNDAHGEALQAYEESQNPELAAAKALAMAAGAGGGKRGSLRASLRSSNRMRRTSMKLMVDAYDLQSPLLFEEGDVINVISAPEGEFWWKGEVNGCIGVFRASAARHADERRASTSTAATTKTAAGGGGGIPFHSSLGAVTTIADVDEDELTSASHTLGGDDMAAAVEKVDPEIVAVQRALTGQYEDPEDNLLLSSDEEDGKDNNSKSAGGKAAIDAAAPNGKRDSRSLALSLHSALVEAEKTALKASNDDADDDDDDGDDDDYDFEHGGGALLPPDLDAATQSTAAAAVAVAAAGTSTAAHTVSPRRMSAVSPRSSSGGARPRRSASAPDDQSSPAAKRSATAAEVKGSALKLISSNSSREARRAAHRSKELSTSPRSALASNAATGGGGGGGLRFGNVDVLDGGGGGSGDESAASFSANMGSKTLDLRALMRQARETEGSGDSNSAAASAGVAADRPTSPLASSQSSVSKLEREAAAKSPRSALTLMARMEAAAASDAEAADKRRSIGVRRTTSENTIALRRNRSLAAAAATGAAAEADASGDSHKSPRDAARSASSNVAARSSRANSDVDATRPVPEHRLETPADVLVAYEELQVKANLLAALVLQHTADIREGHSIDDTIDALEHVCKDVRGFLAVKATVELRKLPRAPRAAKPDAAAQQLSSSPPQQQQQQQQQQGGPLLQPLSSMRPRGPSYGSGRDQGGNRTMMIPSMSKSPRLLAGGGGSGGGNDWSPSSSFASSGGSGEFRGLSSHSGAQTMDLSELMRQGRSSPGGGGVGVGGNFNKFGPQVSRRTGFLNKFRSSAREKPMKMEKIKLFDVPSEELIADGDTDYVPPVLAQAGLIVEQNGATQDVLQLSNLDPAEMQEWQEGVEYGTRTDLSECPPRIAIELINCFFLRLPRPLLTRFDDFLNAAIFITQPSKRVSAARSLVDLHKTADRSLLFWLMSLGVRLRQLGFPTHTHANFAGRFGPSIFRQEMKRQRSMCAVTQFFLDSFEAIFEPSEVKYMENAAHASVVHSAPLDRLIDKCTDKHYWELDGSFLAAFFLTHDYVIESCALLRKFSDAYFSTANEIEEIITQLRKGGSQQVDPATGLSLTGSMAMPAGQLQWRIDLCCRIITVLHFWLTQDWSYQLAKSSDFCTAVNDFAARARACHAVCAYFDDLDHDHLGFIGEFVQLMSYEVCEECARLPVVERMILSPRRGTEPPPVSAAVAQLKKKNSGGLRLRSNSSVPRSATADEISKPLSASGGSGVGNGGSGGGDETDGDDHGTEGGGDSDAGNSVIDVRQLVQKMNAMSSPSGEQIDASIATNVGGGDSGGGGGAAVHERPPRMAHLCRQCFDLANRRKPPMLPAETWTNYDMRDVAVQLTFIDMRLFRAIRPYELLHKAYMDTENGSAPNFARMTAAINKRSDWVATQVLLCERAADRADIICKLLKIAAHCKSLGNYSCLFAIMGGLSYTSVSRLKKTWEKVPKKYLQRFESFSAIVDTRGNFKNYRAELTAARELSVVIPFIGILSKFLFSVEESNPTMVGPNEEHVNFTKLRLMYTQIQDVQVNQAPLSDELSEIDELQLYFERAHAMDKDSLFALSHKLEQREPK